MLQTPYDRAPALAVPSWCSLNLAVPLGHYNILAPAPNTSFVVE